MTDAAAASAQVPLLWVGAAQALVKGAGPLRSSFIIIHIRIAHRSASITGVLAQRLPHKLLHIGAVEVQPFQHQAGSVETPVQHTNGASAVQTDHQVYQPPDHLGVLDMK